MSTLTLRLSTYEPEARGYVHTAQTLADERGHRELEPLHLLTVLVDKDATTRAALEKAALATSDVLIEAEHLLRKRPRGTGASQLSRSMLDLLGRAEGEAARHGGKKVAVRELLLALATENHGAAREVMSATGLSAPILRALLDSMPEGAPMTETQTAVANAAAGPVVTDPLAEFGIDLVAEAKAGRFDPVVGRDDELRRVEQVLARRLESHPLLVGEAGIGKSAIVRELASRIAADDVPLFLRGRRIVALDLAALVAGAKLRGQLEERMRALLAAVRASSGGVILFLPDLGALSGQAAAAGDLLAAALSRGEVQVIAVATPDRMRKFLDDHESLSRRFVPIPIEPPSVDETIAILRGIVPRFEQAHGVRIADAASVAAAHLARRYLQGIELPKGAIDLIDEAAARLRVEREGTPPEIDAATRKVSGLAMQLRALGEETSDDAQRIRERLEKEKAALEGKLEGLRRTQAERATDAVGIVDVDHVAAVVASTTGVPVSKMLEEEAKKLLRMEEVLKQRVVGQDHAVSALGRAVRRARVGLRDAKRPIGSFLFLGPTGVGKTELAKALAEFLFDDEAALTRLDMSEFMEKHMVARLLGSPPGYVDSDEGGYLTEAVRRRPYSVVLFDEMEKAHPDVFDILLQVLDDGRLTDSRGRVAHFQDVVVLFTSNVGSELVLDHTGDNESLRAKIDDALRRRYRPEFLNRIDEIVIFDPLSRESLTGIAGIQLRGVAKMLDARRIGLDVSEAAKDRLVTLGFAPAFGARPLRRAIQRELLDPLAERVLAGGFVGGDTIRVDVVGEAFEFVKK